MHPLGMLENVLDNISEEKKACHSFNHVIS